ncbi:hypothetical protein FHS43_000946 [Streptosporangium becharense]|uniref:ClbS/DfsB family four-helix bundle protein n=1 Tax=Streptosporangium becharense TaxID=1816182 RepID=A0A7W9MGE1_9ACTN|nr:ClbS/DfsB family four-helix bundle protein [Streptosporangium becharense]MBB2909700.1 hypothetical protein [Streptosporangium becharense]MBB5819344.1 hypothetical protein [Streptosporangium becharense]
MARITGKKQLLDEAAVEYDRLVRLMDGFSDEEKATLPVCGEWTIKDLLAHLYGWQCLYFDWWEQGLAGEAVHLPAAGYKWNETPRLNDELYRRFRDVDLAEMRALLTGSHRRMLQHIEALSEDELLKPGMFPWTGRNPLVTYTAPASCNHYRWAHREIRKGTRRPAETGRREQP